MSDIAKNIQEIRERIARAAEACGRAPGDVELLAITKTFTVETISEALTAGQREFGENRVQEAEPKIRYFQGRADPQWHLVGHLQSNKARRAAELFHVIHSIDSIKLARKLSQAAVELGKSLSILVQVDLGLEETKFGARREDVRALVAQINQLPGLRLNGLMTIPPYFEDPGQSRPFFVELRELRDILEAEHPGCLGQRHLSMGMSHDFEAAVTEGSTIVRIGTAIFGRRNPLYLDS